jgi:hypothetical protein
MTDTQSVLDQAATINITFLARKSIDLCCVGQRKQFATDSTDITGGVSAGL